MTVNVSSTQSPNSWKNNTLNPPLNGANSRDAGVIVDKQMATFEHLLTGISWEATDLQEASTNEDVQSDKPTETVEKTEQKQESDETSEDNQGQSAAEQMAAQQAQALDIQTVQQDVKPEETVETTEAPVLEAVSKEDNTVTVEQKVEVQSTEVSGEVITDKQEQAETVQTVETNKIEIKEGPVTERKERRHREEQGSQKNGPSVQSVSQQERGPSREDSSEKKEVKVEAKVGDEFKPQEKLDDVRSNRRSRKERLAERAENPQQNTFGTEDDAISSSDKIVAKADANQQRPDLAAAPPPDLRSSQPLNAVPSPTASAPLAPSANSPSVPENRGVDRLQGTTATPARGEVNSERKEPTTRTEQGNRGEQTQQNSAVDQRQQIRLIQRIARGFERLSDQGGNIRLRLHPPELGSLAMNVRVEGKTLSAEITTETVQAKQALMENLPKLKQQLADNGLTIERFDVRVADRDPNFTQSNLMGGQPRGQDAGSANQSGDWQQRSGTRRADAMRSKILRPEAASGVSGSYRTPNYTGNRGIDVRV